MQWSAIAAWITGAALAGARHGIWASPATVRHHQDELEAAREGAARLTGGLGRFTLLLFLITPFVLFHGILRGTLATFAALPAVLVAMIFISFVVHHMIGRGRFLGLAWTFDLAGVGVSLLGAWLAWRARSL